ncbi:MAG: hypothetical protein K2X39_06735 [Silvanigrellaceae bacterium]|nr:hypothetical protein [Silvanigrellaceae bacterium]
MLEQCIVFSIVLVAFLFIAYKCSFSFSSKQKNNNLTGNAVSSCQGGGGGCHGCPMKSAHFPVTPKKGNAFFNCVKH